jgi:hypothetical protein
MSLLASESFMPMAIGTNGDGKCPAPLPWGEGPGVTALFQRNYYDIIKSC